MSRRLTQIALLASVATLFCTGPAWAYLDPGTGSMMLQLLLGGIAGAMVVRKALLASIPGFVSSRLSGNRRDAVRAKHGRASSSPDAPDG